MQDPYPATFQRRHHNISLGAVFFSLHVNNNLSNKFAAKDISNGSLNQITTTGFYYGSNITEVTPYIKSHKWCLINAYVSGNSASIFVIAGDAIALSIYRNGDGIYSYYPIATKSDLSAYATNAQLLSTFINISNKRYVKITANENNTNYGIIFAVTSQGILCVYSANGNFTTLFESTGNRVNISASGLVTTIDCISTNTHGFILRGGSLKNMPYAIL